MKAILVAVALLVVLAVTALAAQPTDSIPTNIQNSPLVSPIMSGNKYIGIGIGAQIHLNTGSYFYDEGYRCFDWFVPQAQASIVTLANSATAASNPPNTYPGWTQYTTAASSTTGTGTVTLTNTSGVDISVANNASGTAAVVCKGNVTCFNVASGHPCVMEVKFSVPTFTATTGACFVGLGSAITTSTTGAPIWSASGINAGPTQSIGFSVSNVINYTTTTSVKYLAYSVITATASTVTVTAITVSQSDVFQVRLDATTPTAIVLSVNKNATGWYRLYSFDGSAFTLPLQPVLLVAKKNDASVIDLRVRYSMLQVMQP